MILLHRALLVTKEDPTRAMVVELRLTGPPGGLFSAATVRKGRFSKSIAWKDLDRDQIELHYAILSHRALLATSKAPTRAMVVELR